MSTKGAGGTPGGVGSFFLGLALAVAGGYLLTTSVVVTSGGWGWYFWGMNSFGLSLVPFMLGVGILFFDGDSKIGWGFLLAGLAIIVAGILLNLHIVLRRQSLYDLLLMLGLIAGGTGLVVKSLRPAREA